MIRCWMVILSTAVWATFAVGPLYAGEYAHSLEASLKYQYFDYKEKLSEPLKSNETGFLPGLHLTYAYQGVNNPLYGRLLFEYTEGKTDYDGSTQAGMPVKSKTNNRFTNYEANIGYTFKQSPTTLPANIAFYTGFGYRYWNRGLDGQLPYSEEYSWKYIPVGLRGTYRINEKWTGEVDLALWIMFDAEIQVNFSNWDPNFNNPKKSLGNTLGWKIEIPFNYMFLNHWSLEFAPSYEFYGFGKSDPFTVTYAGVPVLSGYEPDSRTNIYSMRLGVKFHF
ncbi:MAG: hypothetical protein ABSB32_00555 [Thermodesulfobacteriota bacterium]